MLVLIVSLAAMVASTAVPVLLADWLSSETPVRDLPAAGLVRA